MATYTPDSLKINAPKDGFQQGGWYSGRQYWNGTLSDPGVIHPESNQVGAGNAVSAEVNAQSAAAQGVTPQQLNSYLDMQRNNQSASGFPAGSGQGFGASGANTGAGVGASTPQALNLTNLYDNLYKNSGVSDLEKSLSEKEKQYAEVKAGINDNPWLSEATRLGRVAKLDEKYQNEAQSLKNDIATKKADIETKLNLELKQFDINSQAAQQALNQFNTLLQMGALDNASGEDIANITRSTGISSNAIYSAINAKKQNDIQTTMQTIDDGTSIKAVVINSKTGEIINETRLGSSKPSGNSKAYSEQERQQYYINDLREDAANGATLKDILKLYSDILDPQLIYQQYNLYSAYGPAKESAQELEKYLIKISNHDTNQYGY